jgi:hypothetical protein
VSGTNECAREVTWGDQTYILNLNHPWVANCLTYRGPAPATCLAKFESGNYSTDEVERILELGLIGGGMSEREADALLNADVRGKPIASNAGVAAGLLVALFVGKPQS